MKRTRWLLIPALLSVMGAMLALSAVPQRAQAARPVDVLTQFINKINAGDGAGAAAQFTPSGVFADTSNGSFAVVGTKALAFGFSDAASTHTHVELTNEITTGSTVTGVASVTDDDSAAAKVSRYLQPFTATIQDDRIAQLHIDLDRNDPETQKYLAYLQSQDSGDEGPPTAALELNMGAGRDGSQTGIADFATVDPSVPDVTVIAIQIEPGPAGVLQPAHLHTGDCPGVGDVASPLASVQDGASFTLISMSMAQLAAGNFAINVHKSAAESALYVSCGEVEAATAVAAPEPAPSPVVPPVGITAPSTGTGPAAARDGYEWLVAMLLTGAVLASSGVALRRVRAAQ